MRILIVELCVDGRHGIQPTYRVTAPNHATEAGVCATSEKVDIGGQRQNPEGRIEALRRALANSRLSR